jgi:hypothetical protein
MQAWVAQWQQARAQSGAAAAAGSSSSLRPAQPFRLPSVPMDELLKQLELNQQNQLYISKLSQRNLAVDLASDLNRHAAATLLREGGDIMSEERLSQLRSQAATERSAARTLQPSAARDALTTRPSSLRRPRIRRGQVLL